MTTTTIDADTSGNPALGSSAAKRAFSERDTRSMTILGTGAKTLFLLVVLIGGGAWGWAAATSTTTVGDLTGGYANTTVTIPGGFWLASFGAFMVGIFLAVNPRRAALLGVVYALLEGFCLGAISAMFDAQTEGIVAAAVLATVGVFVVSWFLYITRIIKPTAKLAFGVTAAIGGLSLLYLFVWFAAIFDFGFLYSEEFRTVGIVVSLIAVFLAALSLTLDFGFIAAATDAGAPKAMEWYGAFGLMVTLIWLYITLLRLFALLARNR